MSSACSEAVRAFPHPPPCKGQNKLATTALGRLLNSLGTANVELFFIHSKSFTSFFLSVGKKTYLRRFPSPLSASSLSGGSGVGRGSPRRSEGLNLFPSPPHGVEVGKIRRRGCSHHVRGKCPKNGDTSRVNIAHNARTRASPHVLHRQDSAYVNFGTIHTRELSRWGLRSVPGIACRQTGALVLL